MVPAGEYERRDDPVADKQVVVPGTYRTVAPAPVSLWRALVDIPKGMADAASVIFLVFLVGAAWTVVERTGVFGTLLDALVESLRGHDALVIPISCLVFAAGGALIQMQEELIAFAPILVLLVARLGFDRVTAVAMSIGAAVIGATFSPIDPFMVGIAQKVADVPLLSGLRLPPRVPLPRPRHLDLVHHAPRRAHPHRGGGRHGAGGGARCLRLADADDPAR